MITRLRTIARNYARYGSESSLFLDAADAIEQLTADLTASRAEIANLTAGFAIAQTAVTNWQDRAVAAEEGCERLRDRYEPKEGYCEHGVLDYDWCESCSKDYKEAVLNNSQT